MRVRRTITRRAIRLRDWLFLDVNRTVLAGGFLAVALAVFVWLEVVGVIFPAQTQTSFLYLFSSLAGGNITLVTIVITINQLVLARELRSPRELRTELQAAEDYRNTVKDETHQATISEQPQNFLQILTESTRHHVREIDVTTDEANGTAVDDEVTNLRSNLLAELDRIVTSLDQSGQGVFPALSTILNADFSTRLTHSRWIREVYADDISNTTRDRLQDLEDRLENLDIARQYLKTIFIQRELAGLSKQVTYTGFIAEVVALSFLMYAGYLSVRPPLLGQAFVIPLSVTLSLAPLAILLSHVLRIATIAERTVAITPFLSP